MTDAAGAADRTDTADANGASEQSAESTDSSVKLIERLLQTLPESTVNEFRDMLGSRLALPTPQLHRQERLATLLSFLRNNGRPPTVNEYHQHHQQMLGQGEHSLALSTLIDQYDSYAEAVKVATNLYSRGTRARAYSRARGDNARTYWTEQLCVVALESCCDQIGHWPTKFEFNVLRTAGTKLAAASGWPGLKLPAEQQIKSLFGSYGEMLKTAQQASALRAQTFDNHARPLVLPARSRTGRTPGGPPKSGAPTAPTTIRANHGTVRQVGSQGVSVDTNPQVA